MDTQIIYTKKPLASITFIILLLICFIVDFVAFPFKEYILLNSNNFYEPHLWYRFVTHAFYCPSIFYWITTVFLILPAGYIIESRYSGKIVGQLIFINIIAGGISWALLNQLYFGYDHKLGGPLFINIGILAFTSLEIITNWNHRNIIEKVITVGLSIILIFSFFPLQQNAALFQISYTVILIINGLLAVVLNHFYSEEKSTNEVLDDKL